MISFNLRFLNEKATEYSNKALKANYAANVALKRVAGLKG